MEDNLQRMDWLYMEPDSGHNRNGCIYGGYDNYNIIRRFFDMTKEKLNIHQRINAVMKELDYVQKENKKVNNQYTFVSHDAVTAAVRVHLVKQGIAVIPSVTGHMQDGNRTEVDLKVDFVNIDKPDDMISVNVFGYGVDQQDKGPGKAFSYAKKYAFLQLFALETGDDPERSNINHEPEPEKKEKLKGPLQRTALRAKLRLYLTAALASTSMKEFKQAGIDYQAFLDQATEQWPEFYDETNEEGFPTFREQITKKKQSIKSEEAVQKQQEQDFQNPLQ